jgi:uncharacterized protein (TIGR02001 family)
LNVKKTGAGFTTAGFLFAAATLGSTAAVPGVASAQALTANVSLVSDYRFRGVSQSFRRPAVQGGVDWAHDSGFYVGTWASTVDDDFLTDTHGVEWDIYGGYKFPLGAGWTGDVGLLQYLYPGESLWNTTELYVGASWQWLSIKYSHSIGDDTFGFADSRGSGYIDLTATYPLREGLNLIAHLGHQRFHNYSDASYTDYKLGATYDWMGVTWGASVIGTDEDFTFTKPNGKTRDLGKATVVVSVSKTF